MHSTLTSFILLSTPIHAATTARIWTHFYPSCPGEPFADLSSYENYEETVPTSKITAGVCTQVGVPSYEHNLVSAISIDAELLSNEKGHNFPPEDGPSCNITIHEVPECIDEPLLNKELHNGVEVSQCHERNFVAYSDVWVQLICEGEQNENDHHRHHEQQEQTASESLEDQEEDIPRIGETTSIQQSSDVQTPGSNANSWHLAQTESSEREPLQESRVNNVGHEESEAIVHRIMEALRHKAHGMNLVSGKTNATRHLNGTIHANGTAPANGTIVSRRKLSVLRNRATRLY
ncbi:uncharacterized protein N7484_002367 [Penicillium longicatenatum]|uniref:uncharacterized protein n=1 Tax=Penicillium longicatenatum TaxID=1561947 RepID=UPI002547C791|nr:uncharacterized protein N7484_002367 [Penicillium longicatenatum]KAJ5658718.1 hypothetical protein N7484_002367 [Penicillium longicatenatum]